MFGIVGVIVLVIVILFLLGVIQVPSFG
jgi:hypothetical protein